MSLPMVSPSELGKQLAVAQTRVASETSDHQYLKMGKDGVWSYGSDELEVEEGSLWAVNPHTFMEGFIAWNDGELEGEEMTLMIGTKPIRQSELPAVSGDGWKKQVAVQMACISGEDKGTQVVYKTSSKGGRKALGNLLSSIVKQTEADPSNLVPVITLESDFYKHKQYGKIYNPLLPVKSWSGMDSDAFDADEGDEAVAEAAPAENTKPAKKAEPEAPVRTRRRRVAE